MPFFCKFFKYSKKISVTLQVRILIIKVLTGRKKVSPSASGSLTLEAALVLPLLLFAGMIWMMPFQMMDIHRQVQATVEHVSEEIGQGAYLSEHAGLDKGWDAVAAYGYAELAVRFGLRDLPVKRISLLRSDLLKDGETINLVVDYEIPMPYSVFGLKSRKQTNRSYRRAWVGADGRTGNGEDEETDDRIVYIGKNGTRYHISRTCHYLYHDLTAVPAGEIENRRNQDGSRYLPCAACKNQGGETVYVMPYGRHYHTARSCSAIQAYVRAVLRSEVEALGACSYCSGKE